MKSWEYKVFEGDFPGEGLAKSGKEGWEVVCTMYNGDFLAKRELEATEAGLEPSLLSDLCKALGWQGGTVHDALKEVRLLRRNNTGGLPT